MWLSAYSLELQPAERLRPFVDAPLANRTFDTIDELLDREKKPMVAVVTAVMRKLPHSIYGMLKHNQDFDGQKFYQMPASAT